MHTAATPTLDDRAPSADGRAPTEATRVRRVLLATDLSSASAAATARALEIATTQGAHLIVLSVIDPGLLRLPGGRFLRRMDQERARVEADIQGVVGRARAGGIRSTFLVWEGDPSEVIVAAADAEDVDLVVMGSHGRGRLGRRLLGSTSTRVSGDTRRRVLVVQS